MTRLYLTSAYTGCHAPDWLARNAPPHSRAALAEAPETADAILFVEQHPSNDPYFKAVMTHPLYRRFKDKCVLYHDADRSITWLPTLSPSIERWQYNPRHHRGCHYIARIEVNKSVDEHVPDYRGNRRYLANFMGSARTHPIRRELLKLNAPDIKLHDTDVRFFWQVPHEQRDAFVEVCDDSYFVLCPRGAGPSSYRLFEAMQLGRVPVIISDEWVPIEGVDWQTCSLRVPEADTNHLPDILRKHQAEAVAMGREARRIWETTFSPEASLSTLSTLAAAVIQEPFDLSARLRTARQFLHPFHCRNLLRAWKKRSLPRKPANRTQTG